MAYDDYLNKNAFAAGGVMQAPDRATWIAQQKVAANALHLLTNKEWNRLANRAFIEKQSFDTAMKQGQYDVQMGRNTPAAATFNRVMQERSGGQVGGIPQQAAVPMPQPAPKAAGALIQGRYGGGDALVKAEAPTNVPGYGSITGMAPYGEGVNIQVGQPPVAAPAPSQQAVEAVPAPTTPAPAPSTLGSDVLDSVLGGKSYLPKPASGSVFGGSMYGTAAKTPTQQFTEDNAQFKDKLMGILGVSKPSVSQVAETLPGVTTTPAAAMVAPKPTSAPSQVANDLLSYDAQLAQTPPAQPAQAQAAPVAPQTQYEQAPASVVQQAQAPAYRPFVAKPFSPSSGFDGQSVTETMAQHGQLQRYVAESNVARQAYTANVNAQSKAARDAVYLELQKLNIGEKRAKAMSDAARQQFAQTGGAFAQTKIGDRDFVIYQPDYGKFAMKEIKKDKENPSLEFVQGHDAAGNPVPFFINTGDGKVHAIPPDALMMMQAMGGGAQGAAPGQAPAKAPKAGQKLGQSEAAAILAEAGGDKAKARKIATDRGYSF